MGNPGVFQGYLYPYHSKQQAHTRVQVYPSRITGFVSHDSDTVWLCEPLSQLPPTLTQYIYFFFMFSSLLLIIYLYLGCIYVLMVWGLVEEDGNGQWQTGRLGLYHVVVVSKKYCFFIILFFLLYLYTHLWGMGLHWGWKSQPLPQPQQFYLGFLLPMLLPIYTRIQSYIPLLAKGSGDEACLCSLCSPVYLPSTSDFFLLSVEKNPNF